MQHTQAGSSISRPHSQVTHLSEGVHNAICYAIAVLCNAQNRDPSAPVVVVAWVGDGARVRRALREGRARVGKRVQRERVRRKPLAHKGCCYSLPYSGFRTFRV